MPNEAVSIISHISIGTNDLPRALEFYDAVLGTLGCRTIMEHPGARAYGKQFPEFWVQTPLSGELASVGVGSHISFIAEAAAEVDAFYAAAIKAGATDDGPPGPRPQYGEPYYGCFVRDLDGHKIEATFYDMALAAKLGQEERTE